MVADSNISLRPRRDRMMLLILGLLIAIVGFTSVGAGTAIYFSRYAVEDPWLVARVKSGVADESIGGIVKRAAEKVQFATLLWGIGAVVSLVGIYIAWPIGAERRKPEEPSG